MNALHNGPGTAAYYFNQREPVPFMQLFVGLNHARRIQSQ